MDDLHELLRCADCLTRELSEAEARRGWACWTATFCELVRQRTGHFRPRDFHWRAFSDGYVRHLSGARATVEYLEQRGQPVMVMPEHWSTGHGFEVSGPDLPDLTEQPLDLYVFPASCDWTMAFTHDPDLGPYFCRREWAATIP